MMEAPIMTQFTVISAIPWWKAYLKDTIQQYLLMDKQVIKFKIKKL